MTVNPKIRSATPKDADGLVAIIDAAYDRYRNRIDDMPGVSQGVGEEISANRVWVAEIDDHLVGGFILDLRDGYAVLVNIAVDPEMSGKGIGRALLARAEAECRQRDIGEIWLTTHSAMPENHRLYSHLGWRETGRSGNKVRMRKVF